MSAIKVGFSRPRGFSAISLAIRMVDGTPYSHTYIRFYSAKFDRWLVYQASDVYVSFTGWTEFQKRSEVVREFDVDVNAEARDAAVGFAIDHAGIPYDTMSAIGAGIAKVAKRFGFPMANPFGDRKGRYFCSELVGEILVELAGDDGMREKLSLLTPRDIYEHLEADALA